MMPLMGFRRGAAFALYASLGIFPSQGMPMEPKQLDKYCPRGLNTTALTEEQYNLAPFNDSCLEKFFGQLTNSLRRFNRWEEIVYTAIYVVISVLAIIGNGLVVWVVLRKRAMRTNRNVLILNLALANLMLAIINVPFLWLPVISYDFAYSRFFCKFANVLPGCNIYCSTCTISVMAIDRYYSVKKLRISSNGLQCVRASLISMAIWIVGFLLSLPLLIHYDITMFYVIKDIVIGVTKDHKPRYISYGWRQCQFLPSQNSSSEMNSNPISLTMGAIQLIFLYIIPLFVLLIFNMKLTRFLKTNADQMSRNRGQRKSRESLSTKRCSEVSSKKVSVANGNNTLHSPSVPSVRSSIAERASQRRNSRTTSLLIAMAGSYALLWFPYSVVTLLLDLGILFHETYPTMIERIDQLCKMISMLSICINPFLYGFLNTNFRNEFSAIYYRLIRCQRKPFDTSSRYTHDFSSLALPTRNNSLHAEQFEDNSLLSAIGRSFRGSFHRMRSSFRSDAGSFSTRGEVAARCASADRGGSSPRDPGDWPPPEDSTLGEELLQRDSFV